VIFNLKEIYTYEHANKIRKLLHEEYQDCDLIIFNTFGYTLFLLRELFKTWKVKELYSELKFIRKTKINGVYSPYTQCAYIFPKYISEEMSEYGEYDMFIARCSMVLCHELRHHLHHKYNRYEKWGDDMIEKDAMKFEIKMFNRFSDEFFGFK